MICSLQSSSPTFVGHVNNLWVMNCLYRVFSAELDSVPGRLCPPPGGSPAALGRDRTLEWCLLCVYASHFCRGYYKLHWGLRKSGPLCVPDYLSSGHPGSSPICGPTADLLSTAHDCIQPRAVLPLPHSGVHWIETRKSELGLRR